MLFIKVLLRRLFLGTGMRSLIDIEQVCNIDLCVSLGCTQRAMTKLFLNASQIGSCGEEMGCTTVTHGMRMKIGYIVFSSRFSTDLPHRAYRKSFSIFIEEEGRRFW